MQAPRVTKAALLLSTLLTVGCATVDPIPVAVQCPPFPTPPAPLMIAPAINDFSAFYNTLMSKPPASSNSKDGSESRGR